VGVEVQLPVDGLVQPRRRRRHRVLDRVPAILRGRLVPVWPGRGVVNAVPVLRPFPDRRRLRHSAVLGHVRPHRRRDRPRGAKDRFRLADSFRDGLVEPELDAGREPVPRHEAGLTRSREERPQFLAPPIRQRHPSDVGRIQVLRTHQIRRRDRARRRVRREVRRHAAGHSRPPLSRLCLGAPDVLARPPRTGLRRHLPLRLQPALRTRVLPLSRRLLTTLGQRTMSSRSIRRLRAGPASLDDLRPVHPVRPGHRPPGYRSSAGRLLRRGLTGPHGAWCDRHSHIRRPRPRRWMGPQLHPGFFAEESRPGDLQIHRRDSVLRSRTLQRRQLGVQQPEELLPHSLHSQLGPPPRTPGGAGPMHPPPRGVVHQLEGGAPAICPRQRQQLSSQHPRTRPELVNQVQLQALTARPRAGPLELRDPLWRISRHALRRKTVVHRLDHRQLTAAARRQR
jgi:hypothetical protein